MSREGKVRKGKEQGGESTGKGGGCSERRKKIITEKIMLILMTALVLHLR